MDRLPVPPLLSEFSRPFTASGHQCYLVGGAVRDMVLGKDPEDFDIATDARPEEVMRLFRSVIPTGIKHGTVTVRYKGHSIEVTTFRTEADYDDARHPSSIIFSGDISEDLERRDFTMNALALDCASGRLVDEHEGQADIGRKIVRAIGDPLERFREDGLRPLRAIRFSAQLGFTIDESTLDAIPRSLERTRMVSAERVRDEFSKILLSPRPFQALRLFEDSGLMAMLLPELWSLRSVEQSPPHRFDALRHSLHACQGSPARLELRLAALLHDLGKADRRSVRDDGTVNFIGHEASSAEKARALLLRLKYPNAIIDYVCHLVLLHMTRYEEDWTDAAVRRFLARAGEDKYRDVLSVLSADEYGLEGRPSTSDRLLSFERRIEAVLAKEHAFSLKDLAIGGKELSGIGVDPGKGMGIILKELLEAVLDDPELNTRERLLDIAGRLRDKLL